MEYLDVVDERDGEPCGEVVARDVAHERGICHRTAHVWVVRQAAGTTEVLLQRRAETKESFPGLFDTSCAGHVTAGDDPRTAAARELSEELGICAELDALEFCGTFRIAYERCFHGREFRDNEVAFVYLLCEEVDEGTLTLQEEEVSEVRWFALDEVCECVREGRGDFCVPLAGLEVLRRHLSLPHMS